MGVIVDVKNKFFNDHAEKWYDMCYKDLKTGLNKHQNKFERLFSLLQLKPGSKVLDVGCGSGILVPFIFKDIKNGILHELDSSEKMIEVNKKQNTQNNIKFIIADIEAASLENEYYDVIICFSCFPHFHNKQKTLNKIYNLLKENGIVVICNFKSTKELNKLHASHLAVKHDIMPNKKTMEKLLLNSNLNIKYFIEEDEFYYIMSKKVINDKKMP